MQPERSILQRKAAEKTTQSVFSWNFLDSVGWIYYNPAAGNCQFLCEISIFVKIGLLKNACWYIIKELIDFFNKKIDEAQVNIDILNNQKLNQYIDKAQEIIGNAVLTVSQTYVDTLKKNGSFDEASQEEAKNKAIEIVNKMITEESKNAIIILYGDFNTYLDSMIESLVKQNKTK